jgi:hypothetical protein
MVREAHAWGWDQNRRRGVRALRDVANQLRRHSALADVPALPPPRRGALRGTILPLQDLPRAPLLEPIRTLLRAGNQRGRQTPGARRRLTWGVRRGAIPREAEADALGRSLVHLHNRCLTLVKLLGPKKAGHFCDGVHASDVSDLMRRMVKENLLKFDATPLFPDRLASNGGLQALRCRGQPLQGRHRLPQEFKRAEAL